MIITTVLPSQHIQVQGQKSLTPGATVTVDISDNTVNLFTWTAGEAETIIATGTHNAGRIVVLLITCDATPRTMTFGSGFLAQATFVLSASKKHTVTFISDGTNFYEVSRITMA